MLTLEIKTREPKSSPEMLRARGVLPAVFYGPKESSTPVEIDAPTFERVWKEAGETTVIALRGVGDEKESLIHDVQFHPVTGVPLHADFYVLEKGKKITISVPLVFVGETPAEKAGHIVVKALHEVEIEVAPSELPRDLPVDISPLANVGDHIVAKEIRIPQSAKLLSNPEEIVVSITEFKEEKVEVPAAPVAEGAAAAVETPAEAATEKQEGAEEKKGE